MASENTFIVLSEIKNQIQKFCMKIDYILIYMKNKIITF